MIMECEYNSCDREAKKTIVIGVDFHYCAGHYHEVVSQLRAMDENSNKQRHKPAPKPESVYKVFAEEIQNDIIHD